MLNTRVSFSFLVLLFTLIMRFQTAQADSFLQSEQKDTAIVWFNNGQYDKALPVFSALCFNYPYDYMVKYYYGACLVETGSYVMDAEKNLLLASTSDVPEKVYFYLGRFYHATGNWNNALRYYNRFKNHANKNEIADLRVDELTQLCYSQINPFITEKVTTQGASETQSVKEKVVQAANPVIKFIADTVKTRIVAQVPATSDTTVKVNAKTSPVDSLIIKHQSDSLKASMKLNKDSLSTLTTLQDTVKSKVKFPHFIDFQINDKVTYLIEDMFQVAEAKNEFRKAANQEKQLDSLLLEVQHLRKLYHNSMKPVLRDSLAVKIQDQENRNILLNTEMDQHYNQARKMEQEWWKDADYSVYESFMAFRDSLTRLRTIPPVVPLIPVTPDTIPAIRADTVAVKEVPPDNTAMETPKTGKGNEISFRIQIGAYGKIIPAQKKAQFARLEKIRTIDKFVNDKGITVYTTGNLKNYDDALKLQMQIRQEGIKDAFVIALKNGKRVLLKNIKH